MRLHPELLVLGAIAALTTTTACSSLLSLGDYRNQCGGALDSPETCQGGGSSASSTAGAGGGGGSGGGSGSGGAECHASSDCTTPSACVSATCSESRVCVTNNTAPGSPCSEGNRTVCDGDGHCVACNKVADCSDSGTACITTTCTGHACVTAHATSGTACTDHGGNLCDGKGRCFGAAQITTGGAHTCALTTLGDVECWGDDDHGQLGDGQTMSSPMPVQATVLTTTATAVSAGLLHTCAITSGGGIVCWGTSMEGETGMNLPTSGATVLSAGERHNCAMGDFGLVCWGDNTYGQLGCGTNCTGVTQSPTPVPPQSTFGYKSVTAGGASTCAITSGGNVQCWGNNSAGQLGDGTKIQRTKPTPVVGLGAFNIVALAVGNIHVCALTTTGAVYCWGDNTYGQLGDGTGMSSLTPVAVMGLSSGVKAISAGEIQSCALLSDGSAVCWGDNQIGDIGDGTNSQRNAPVPVSGLSSGVAGVSCGYNFSCALLATGAVQCWGDDGFGELGDGMMMEELMPVDVLGI